MCTSVIVSVRLRCTVSLSCATTGMELEPSFNAFSCVGRYCKHVVSIRIDPQAESSAISSRFAGRCNLPSRVRTDRGCVAKRYGSGPVFVATDGGEYAASFEIEILAVPDVGAVLGLDWIRGTGAHARQGCMSDPAQGQDARRYPQGFGWSCRQHSTSWEAWVPLVSVATGTPVPHLSPGTFRSVVQAFF